jgi:hypothetical protein
VDLDPDFIFLVMVLAEPIVKALGVLELADLVRVALDGRN